MSAVPALSRAVVAGAGSLGTVYGAALALAGTAVQLLAREAHARSITEQGGVWVSGLSESGERELVALEATADPAALRPAGLILVGAKSHDIAAVLADLKPIRESAVAVASIANGVVKDERLTRWCGTHRVVGLTSMVGGTLDAPGEVRCSLRGTTYLGRASSTGPAMPELVAPVADLLRGGGLPVSVVDDIDVVEWVKLVHAAAAMAVTALPGRSLVEALDDPDLARLYVLTVREGDRVAAAAGIRLRDVAGMFPIRSICDAGDARAVELVRAGSRQLAALTSGPVHVSMLEDVRRGRRLELDDVHGYLVNRASEFGVAVPVLQALLLLLRAQAVVPAGVFGPKE